jgi:flagellar basal body rod protein FlgG
MNISSNVNSMINTQYSLNESANKIVSTLTLGGSQQVDFAKEMTNLVSTPKALDVNVSAIKTQDEMMGSLLDIKA